MEAGEPSCSDMHAPLVQIVQGLLHCIMWTGGRRRARQRLCRDTAGAGAVGGAAQPDQGHLARQAGPHRGGRAASWHDVRSERDQGKAFWIDRFRPRDSSATCVLKAGAFGRYNELKLN